MITRQPPVVTAVMPRDVPICEILDSFKPKARMKILIGMTVSQTEIVLVGSVGAFGLCLFVMQGIVPPGISTMDIYKSVTPFILLDMVAITIFVFFPQIVTILPNLMTR
jgi:TRAP-type mannitol/chloroaromatic compound transport system permease large subunit